LSNYVVSKGLAGGFLTTQGWGGIGVPEAGAIVRLSTGAMRINVSKVGANVVLTYSDSSNNVTCQLPATPEQIAGEDWMIVSVRRLASNLLVRLGKGPVTTIALAQVVSLGGNCTMMDGSPGGLYDLRIVPRAISDAGGDYYNDDLTENAGKALLPNR